MLSVERVGRYRVPESEIIVEGGAIHTDGEGTLLITEQCLLRLNPTKSKKEIEAVLKRRLNVECVI